MVQGEHFKVYVCGDREKRREEKRREEKRREEKRREEIGREEKETYRKRQIPIIAHNGVISSDSTTIRGTPHCHFSITASMYLCTSFLTFSSSILENKQLMLLVCVGRFVCS